LEPGLSLADFRSGLKRRLALKAGSFTAPVSFFLSPLQEICSALARYSSQTTKRSNLTVRDSPVRAYHRARPLARRAQAVSGFVVI
jgi:hypothetical protein